MPRSMVALVIAMIAFSLLAEPVGKWIGFKLSGYDTAKARSIDKQIMEREKAQEAEKTGGRSH